MTDRDWEILAERQSCRLLSRDDLARGRVPTTATASSIVAGFQAQEVAKLLHAHRVDVQPLMGGIVVDGTNNDVYPIRYPVRDDCLAHYRYNPLIPIDDAHSMRDRVTFCELAARAFPEVERVDDSTPIVVDLGDDHVVKWHCTNCRSDEAAGSPVSLVEWGDGACPRCGKARQPTLATSVAVPGPHADRPLKELGIRDDEILPVRYQGAERYAWLRRPDSRLGEEWSDVPVRALCSDPAAGT
jgi:adenylyltransferase/sulfurtransferase